MPRNQFPNPEDIRMESSVAWRKAYEILKEYPKSVRNAIAKHLNNWQWDEVLGEKPKDWDNMRPYRKPWMSPDEIVRDDYIRPYMAILLVCGIDC